EGDAERHARRSRRAGVRISVARGGRVRGDGAAGASGGEGRSNDRAAGGMTRSRRRRANQSSGVAVADQAARLVSRTPGDLAPLRRRHLTDEPHREEDRAHLTARRDVVEAADRANDLRVDAGFLLDFAPRRLLRRLARLDVALGQHPVVRRRLRAHEKDAVVANDHTTRMRKVGSTKSEVGSGLVNHCILPTSYFRLRTSDFRLPTFDFYLYQAIT